MPPPPLVLRIRDSDGHSSLGGNHAPTTVVICNESTCTLRLLRSAAKQIDGWEFPQEIMPRNEAEVEISFKTDSKTKIEEDHGECSYVVLSADNKPLSDVTITADASKSTGIVGTVAPVVEVRWGNLSNVFGLKLTPVDGQLGFKHKGKVEMKIEGNPLDASGDRVETAEGKVSAWMQPEELEKELQIGDIIAANRGMIYHYGIAYRKDPRTGKTILAHLNGTAEDVLGKFKVEALEEVMKAVKVHGGIAYVQEATLEAFSNGDDIRIHNAYDHKLKPFSPDVIVERIKATMGYRDYSLSEFNCEHFAHLMRYGLTYSGQTEDLIRLNEHFKLKMKNFRGEEFLQDALSGKLSVQFLQDGFHKLQEAHFAPPE